MVVAVQHQLGALGGEHAAKIFGVNEAAQRAARRGQRRMMNEHDAEQAVGMIERFGQARQLLRAEPACRHERAGRHAGRQRDQRDVAATPHERKTLAPVVAAHVVAPIGGGRLFDGADIDVVIAGDDGDIARRADAFRAMAGRTHIRSGSDRLTRSPVTAMWSTGALKVAVMASSTSRRWMYLRLRCQLMKPSPRLPASWASRGRGAMCRSDRWASVNIDACRKAEIRVHASADSE